MHTFPFARTVSLPDGSKALIEVFVTVNAVADLTVAVDTSDLDAALERFARSLPVPSTREVRTARSAAWLETYTARHEAVASIPRLVVPSTPTEDVEEYDETSKSNAFLHRRDLELAAAARPETADAEGVRSVPALFTQAGDDEYNVGGAMSDEAVLQSLAAEADIQHDGYRYIALGKRTRAALARLATTVSGVLDQREAIDDGYRHSEGVRCASVSHSDRCGRDSTSRSKIRRAPRPTPSAGPSSACRAAGGSFAPASRCAVRSRT